MDTKKTEEYAFFLEAFYQVDVRKCNINTEKKLQVDRI